MRKRPVSVIELAGYRRRADELLTREQQDALIDLVAYEPTFGDLIPGSGGLRKARVAIERRGKRGGARVIHYFHDADVPILLLALYAKNEKDDLTPREKKEFGELARKVVLQWRKGPRG
jgi:hypothetical protein